MGEGAVYRCSWSIGKNGLIKIWISGNRKLQACGRTFKEAEDALFEVICLELGDGEPKWDYDKPPPVSEEYAHLFSPHIVRLTGDVAVGDVGDPARLYSGGVCHVCRAGAGERTSEPLKLETIPSGFEGAFVSAARSIAVYSERFLSVLPSAVVADLDLAPVNFSGRSRRPFFELRGHPTVSLGGYGPSNAAGWVCQACGFRTFGYWGEPGVPKGVYQFLSKAQLPDPLPDYFVLGDASGVALATEHRNYRRLRTEARFRGVLGQDVGVVPEAEFDRDPPLHIAFGKDCALCAARPFPSGESGMYFGALKKVRTLRIVTFVRKHLADGTLRQTHATPSLEEFLSPLNEGRLPKREAQFAVRCNECHRLGYLAAGPDGVSSSSK